MEVASFPAGSGSRSLKLGKVGVLMGGVSSERDISLKSGKAVYESLKQSGIDAVSIDLVSRDKEEVSGMIVSSGIKHAFIALHGEFGEDGELQGIIEELGISYTGSGVEASRIAMDKAGSRELFRKSGLDVPRYIVLNETKDSLSSDISSGGLKLPLVIKPAAQGSSIGLSIVDNEESLQKAITAAFRFDARVLVEEYIGGREVTVGILNDLPLPVIGISPKNKFFDYEAKYKPGMTDYIIPAGISEDEAGKAQSAALSAHKALGCYGCSRIDMILRQDGRIFVLEVNTIPGFTETSLLPKAAKHAGISFAQLCLKLLESSLARSSR